MSRFIAHWILVLAALWHPGCEAGVLLSAAQENYTIAAFDVALLKDAGGRLTVEELERPGLAARFVQLTGPPQLGYTREVVWLRLRLQRLEDAPQTWYLEYSNPFINDLRLYSRSATGFTVVQAGDQFAFAERVLKFPLPVFALAFPDAAVQTFYLRMDSDSTLAGQLLVWQPEAMREHAQQGIFWVAAALGMVCMSFLISIVHWLHGRERRVLQFAVLTVNVFFMVASGLGLVAPFFAPTVPMIGDLMAFWVLALTTAATGIVFGNVLHIRADFPRTDQFIKLAYAAALLAPFTRAFNMYNVWGGPMLQIAYLLVIFSTAWVAWIRWRSNARGAAYFFAAHVVIIGSVLTGRLVSLGLIPVNGLTNLSWIPGMLTFLFLVHAGIFVDSQWMKKERDAAFAKAKTAEEVLLSERTLRDEQSVFFAFVAHELRSPLAAILTGIRNLEDELAEVLQNVPARTRRIKAYAERMGALIERHLSLQRLAYADFSPQLGPVDPRHIAEESLRHVQGLFVRRVFAPDYAVGLPISVSADPDLLRMGLENLLINAAKFSPTGAAIDLEVFAGTALHFRVSDRGPGIQAPQMGRLFSAFNRAQQPGFKGGFGIGLAIAHRVAEAHGGALEYADRVGGGAMFTLSLPVVR